MSDASPPPPPRPENPATLDDPRELLARTPGEEALDALAQNPDARSLEALRQHLRHQTTAVTAGATPPPEDPTPR